MTDEKTALPADAISVVIPTCDRPISYLLEAIASVRRQSLTPLEILVIDNGCRAVAPETLPEGVVLHRIGARSGASLTRNFGAAMVRGRWLAFLDDDDWWDDNFLRHAASRAGRGDVRVVFGRIVDIYEGRQIGSRALREPVDLHGQVLMGNSGTSGNNLLIERTLFFSAGGFRRVLKTSEDRALAADILLLGEPIGSASEAITYARHHAGERLRLSLRSRMVFYMLFRQHYGLRGTLAYFLKIVQILQRRAVQRLRVLLSRIKRRILA